MDKDEAKSRKPPHSASSSEQQPQKKITPNDFDFGKAKSNKFPFFGNNVKSKQTIGIGGTTGTFGIGNLISRPRLGKGTKSGNSSLDNFFLSRNSSTSRSRAATATGSSATTAAIKPTVATARGLSDSTMSKGNVVVPAIGGSKQPATATLKTSSQINVAPSPPAPAAASIAGGIVANVAGDNSSIAPLAIGDATATNANPFDLKVDSNAAVDPGTSTSEVKESESDGGLTMLRVGNSSKSFAVYVLNAPPVEGEPLSVIGGVDSIQRGKLKLQDLLHTDVNKWQNMGPAGRKVSLLAHKNPQGDTKECVWLVIQDVANEQKFLFKGKLVTKPANRAARGYDENELPLQILSEEMREHRRSRFTQAVTLDTTDGTILATLPLSGMANGVLGVRRSDAVVGSTIRGVNYVHTEVIDKEVVETSRVVSIRVRRYTSTDGEMGVTTELGEMVLARPHLVMPRDAMPLPRGQRRVNTSVASLHDYSVAHRVSVLCSEVGMIPDLEEKFVEYLKRLETLPETLPETSD